MKIIGNNFIILLHPINMSKKNRSFLPLITGIAVISLLLLTAVKVLSINNNSV